MRAPLAWTACCCLAALAAGGWKPAADAGAAEPAAGASSVRITSGGVAVTVDYVVGTGTGKRPIVVLVHGADGFSNPFSKANYKKLAEQLARRGFLVAVVHYFERTGTTWAGSWTQLLNYGKWYDTVRDAVTAAGKHPRGDGKRVALVGVSLGGTLALNVAAMDRRVGAVVDYFGGVPDIIANQIKRMPPTLILHGEKDRIVSVNDSRKLDKLLKRLGVAHEMKLYPDAGHGFVGADLTDSLDRAAKFLRKHLR